MKVLVTGGTGFIGSCLVRKLFAADHDVTVLTRGDDAERGGVHLKHWDPEKPGAWARHVDGMDAVIHLAGRNLFEQRWTDEFIAECKRSRELSTRHLAQAIADAEVKPKVLVSASAIGYYGLGCGDAWLTESSPPSALPPERDPLADITRVWEAAAEPAREAGVRVAHPRIGLVLSPEGGVLERFVPIFRLFAGGPLGSGEQYMPWIHRADAVDALMLPLHDTTITGPYNLTAPNPVTMREFADTLGRVMQRPSFARVPEFALRIALGQQADAVIESWRVRPAQLEEHGFSFKFAELEPALRDLVA